MTPQKTAAPTTSFNVSDRHEYGIVSWLEGMAESQLRLTKPALAQSAGLAVRTRKLVARAVPPSLAKRAYR